MSAAIKPSYLRLDLGNVGIDDLCSPDANFTSLWNECTSGRVPPLLPEIVKKKFDNREVVFTSKSDIERVKKLYDQFFQAVSSSEKLKRRT